MKILIINFTVLLFCLSINAQNKNVVKETKTTILKVNNGTPITTVKTEETDKDGKVVETLRSKSNLYIFNGKQYIFIKDDSGYKVTTPENENLGLLKKTPNGNWIYKTKENTAFGFFDTKGNLVLEKYDESTDNVIEEIYSLMK